MLLSIVVLNSSFTNPSKDIIGIWISKDDSEWKIEFRNDGKCYWYYTNEDTETFSYSINKTTPQCGEEVKIDGLEDYYLNLRSEVEFDLMCYEILGVDNKSLSIKEIGTNNKRFFFTKQ